MRIILTIMSTVVALAVLCCAGCSRPGDSLEIKREQFIGHTFRLISDKQIQQFTFSSNGSAGAYIGFTDAWTFPLVDWKIVGRHSLVITDPPGKFGVSYKFRVLSDTNAITTTGEIFMVGGSPTPWQSF